MFATFTDWEFSDMDAMTATGRLCGQVQAAGQSALKLLQRDQTARTDCMADAATAQAAIDGLRRLLWK